MNQQKTHLNRITLGATLKETVDLQILGRCGEVMKMLPTVGYYPIQTTLCARMYVQKRCISVHGS